VIVEERIYRVKPGKAPDYIKAYEQEGLAIQAPFFEETLRAMLAAAARA